MHELDRLVDAVRGIGYKGGNWSKSLISGARDGLPGRQELPIDELLRSSLIDAISRSAEIACRLEVDDIRSPLR